MRSFDSWSDAQLPAGTATDPAALGAGRPPGVLGERGAQEGQPRAGARGRAALSVAGAVAAGLVVVFLAVGTRHPHVRAASGGRTVHGSVPRGPGLLRIRPLHIPILRPGERCPTTPGARSSDPYLSRVDTLGNGPVRPDIGDRVDLAHGRIVLGTTDRPGWFAIETVWFSSSSYDGPWIVRAARLSGSGRIELGEPLGPRRGAPRVSTSRLQVASGPNAPGTSWISAPGCYAWQVDGDGFSQVIAFEALAPR